MNPNEALQVYMQESDGITVGIPWELAVALVRAFDAMDASIARFMSPDQSDLDPRLVEAATSLVAHLPPGPAK